MSAFIKQDKSNPLGDYLRESRLNLGITIKKASRDLNIASKYLEALENQEPRLAPGGDYFEKWLYLYANYLGLSKIKVDELRAGNSKIEKSGYMRKSSFLSVSELFSQVFIVLAISGLVVFLLFRVNAIFSPPPLQIISPQDGTISHDRQLLVKGITVQEAELVINNKAVFVDQGGEFETSVDLQSGLNLIKITAKKRYSRPQEVNIRVLFGE